MEKLYNCEILDENLNYDKAEVPLRIENKNFISISSKSPSLELYFKHNNNLINYTELYRKFKKNNCSESYNKLPICAYRYPKNTKICNFDELKRELLYDEVNEEKNKNTKYYNSDLKIFLPNKLENAIKKQKKSLRKKIYDGEVMFYEDYLEKLAAKDYEYFFRKSYKIKRRDEGGKYYFYGKKLEMEEDEDIYRNYYGFDDEYFIKKLGINEKLKKKLEKSIKKKKEKEEIIEKECEKSNHKNKNLVLNVKELNEVRNLNTYDLYKKNKNIIFDQNLFETKKQELLNGYIPDIILPVNNRKTKHPKKCTVPFVRLKAYAKNLEDLFTCPYLYNAIDAELAKNWKTSENNNLKKLKIEKIKKGYKKDIYSVTKEQLEKSNEKMKILLNNGKGNDEDVKILLNFKIQKKERESKTVSNGRYII